MIQLVLVNLFRNPLRTFLTMASVTVAIFLYCALGGVLDTLQESIKVGSETRLITRNKVSLIFPLPLSYRARLEAVPGVNQVATSNWFGGTDPNAPREFFAQFAVDPTYFAIYRKDMNIIEASPAQGEAAVPEGTDPKLAAYFLEQTACVVGEKLMLKKGWKLGQTITVGGTIYPGDWQMTIRAVYRATNKSFGEEVLFFPFKYLDQRGMGGRSAIGIYVLQLSDPSRAAEISNQIDSQFDSSAPATRTESEQAFQAGFVSMYGNLPFVLRVIGLAIVFSILLIAANTMMTAVRERTGEFGVLKTLGFTDRSVFTMVVIEAAVITLGGGAIGALLAKFVVEGSGFNAMGFLPPMSVYWSTVAIGVGMSVVIGAVSGLVPAFQVSQRRIVDALRRVE
jgi:putative ABC transport system permease protein